MVIKVDFSVGWEEGVGQFPCGAIEAVVGQGLQAVCVVDGVETCGKSSRLRGMQQVEGYPAGSACQEAPGSLERSLVGSQVFSNLQSHKMKDKCKAFLRTDGNTQPRADPGFRAVPRGHK